MNTLFLLMARYNGLPIIPVDIVCRDYFRGGTQRVRTTPARYRGLVLQSVLQTISECKNSRSYGSFSVSAVSIIGAMQNLYL